MTRPPYITEELVSVFIQQALWEDIGEEDYSSRGSVSASHHSKNQLLVKQRGVIAGLELAEKIVQQYDERLHISFCKKDGDEVYEGDVAFYVEGPSTSILSTERLVLNCIQRMSGIATYTKYLHKIIENTGARLRDTRKTTPRFRLMEKWAVVIGGGLNHRLGLYDMVMLKDNHIDMAGGIEAAMGNLVRYLNHKGKKLKIEIETRTLEEVEEALRVGGMDTILLDNMSLTNIKKAVKKIGKEYKTEASGGITESTIREIAETGVDYISVGALTHAASWLDMSLKVIQ